MYAKDNVSGEERDALVMYDVLDTSERFNVLKVITYSFYFLPCYSTSPPPPASANSLLQNKDILLPMFKNNG